MDKITWVTKKWAVCAGDEAQAIHAREHFRLPCYHESGMLVFGPLLTRGMSFRDGIVYGEGDSVLEATAAYLKLSRPQA